jgi:hypothetical protein
MQLSEAIRLGATMSGQIYHVYALGDRTCAMGGALLAVGRLDEVQAVVEDATKNINIRASTCHDILVDAFPILDKHYDLLSSIVWKNDIDKLTREQIADFVEQRELELGFLTVKAEETEEARAKECALVEA